MTKYELNKDLNLYADAIGLEIKSFTRVNCIVFPLMDGDCLLGEINIYEAGYLEYSFLGNSMSITEQECFRIFNFLLYVGTLPIEYEREIILWLIFNSHFDIVDIANHISKKYDKIDFRTVKGRELRRVLVKLGGHYVE